jgi:hypothetical protein
MNYAQMEAAGLKLDRTFLTYHFTDGTKQVPVCYSADAIKYGQSAFFVGAVIL